MTIPELPILTPIPDGHTTIICGQNGECGQGRVEDIARAHVHDELYSPLSHDHDTDYAPLSHIHEDYALSEHYHTSVYAEVEEINVTGDEITLHIADEGLHIGEHNHNNEYAALNHNHDIEYVGHALATAANDFLVASGSGAFAKKTLAETKTILGIDSDMSLVVASGRLTLTSGTPITISDVTAAATLYFTPYQGNQIALYTGSVWQLHTFTEVSLSLTGATANKNSDLFLYDNSGTLTLERVEWTDDTTRATALALQDGIYVKSGTATRRYLGTIRTTGTTGQTEDSFNNRFVWNYAHPVRRILRYTDTTNTWTYATGGWRQTRGQSGAYVKSVCGIVDVFRAYLQVSITNYGLIGIGINNTSAANRAVYPGSSGESEGVVVLTDYLREGFNIIYPLEKAYTGYTATYRGSVTTLSENTMIFEVEVTA